MFSAIIGAGAGIATGIMGARAQNAQTAAQYAIAQQQIAQQREQADMMHALALDAERRRTEENAYLREREWADRQTTEEERQWQLGQLGQYQGDLRAERQFDIDRQSAWDAEAARLADFRFDQLMRNQDLSAQERAFAIEQLRREQGLATDERDLDLARLAAESTMLADQRQFYLDEYGAAHEQAGLEQSWDLAQRDDIMGRIDGLTSTLDGIYNSFEPAPRVRTLSEADIDREIRKRTDQYVSDVDRAADRVASINEADLIRDGLDQSTAGTARRGEVAGRLADEYQNARQRAYDDALAYITGEQAALTTNVNDIMGNRGAILGEAASVRGSGINEMTGLPNVQSRLPVYNMASAAPSAVNGRGVLSATGARGPIGIGSSIYDRDSLHARLSDMNNIGSAANYGGQSVGSSIYEPTGVALSDPTTYYQGMANAQNRGQDILSAAGRIQPGATAGRVIGDNARQLFNDISGPLDKWLGQQFSGPGQFNFSVPSAPMAPSMTRGSFS